MNDRPPFATMWERACSQFPDRPFLSFVTADTTTSWSYGEFDAVVARVAASLAESGVGRGDAVHLVLRNCPAFVALWLAAARLGAWIIPVDPASTARDIDSQVGRVRPVLGVCAGSAAPVYHEGAIGRVPRVLELDETADDLDPSGPFASAEDHAVPAVAVTADDRLAVMFTSGTTGEPKGVVLTQGNYTTVAETMAGLVDLRPRHRWLVTLPLFHANAQYYCIGPAIAVGASVAITSAFSASRWATQARAAEATHASLFAAPIRMILDRTPTGTAPLALEHVWFAQALGADHYDAFAELVGCRPRQLYGMTETIAVVTADLGAAPSNDLIGRPIAGRVVEVVDPATGGPAAPGLTGELIVRGRPGADLFLEYLDDPATTGKVLKVRDDGVWFHTGDHVVATSDGVLRFVGRRDDVIKVAGENVSLSAIEAVVAQAPGILEAAVIARHDPIRDQVPVAYVVAKDPATAPSAARLEQWAEQNLPSHSRPREWHFIEKLPRTSVGKVRRFRIDT